MSTAKLPQIYTNHSVRASAISMLSDANVPDRHIMFISGHSSEQSKAHYSSRPSVSQLESVSDAISNALENQQPQSTQISTVTSAPLMQSPNRMASNVSMSTATASLIILIYNFDCNINTFRLFISTALIYSLSFLYQGFSSHRNVRYM